MQIRNIRECSGRLQEEILTLEKVFRKVLSEEETFELEQEFEKWAFM